MPSASPPPYFSGIQINDEEEQCSGSCSSDFQKTTERFSMSWGRPGFQKNIRLLAMIFSSSFSQNQKHIDNIDGLALSCPTSNRHT
jgi:hypothetical protein